jgi:hypothetical protein
MISGTIDVVGVAGSYRYALVFEVLNEVGVATGDGDVVTRAVF